MKVLMTLIAIKASFILVGSLIVVAAVGSVVDDVNSTKTKGVK